MAGPPMPGRCACIDVGSNTTRLLVAEADAGGGLRVVAHDKAFTRLGGRRAADGCLATEKVTQTAAAVAAQAALAAEHGAAHVAVVATAAVRDAPNAALLHDAVTAATGLVARVLSAAEEAELAFAGATHRLPRDGEAVGVVDVGGGSTEMIVGRCGEAPWSASLALGSGALADDPTVGDPPSREALEALHAHATAAFGALRPPPARRALAVGGSATSVALLLGGDVALLDEDALGIALNALSRDDAATVAARHGIDPRRAALLPAGLVLLALAVRTLGAPLSLAPGGLREGVILAMLDDPTWPRLATSPD